MTAVLLDIVVEQGATFDLVVDLLDEDGHPRTDLGGYTGAMQIRTSDASDASDATLLGTASVTVDDVNSQAVATITDTDTRGYSWTAGRWDLEITNGSRTERIATGNASLRREVTR